MVRIKSVQRLLQISDNQDIENVESFNGFQWSYFANMAPGPLKERADLFISEIDWDQLRAYASSKRQQINCQLLPDVGLGYNHMVRVLEFDDRARWIARLRMPSLDGSLVTSGSMIAEYTTNYLVISTTKILIPKIYAVESDFHPLVKAPFMLMDCLEGNVGMDLGMQVPSQSKASFFDELAQIHVGNIYSTLPDISQKLIVILSNRLSFPRFGYH
jgi:hypothetical protein